VGIDDTADVFGEENGRALRFARRVAQSVDQWKIRAGQDAGGRLDRLVRVCRPAIDQRSGLVAEVVTEEPRPPQGAGTIRAHDAPVFGVQVDVVADAAARRARRVGDNGPIHVRFAGLFLQPIRRRLYALKCPRLNAQCSMPNGKDH
jgi:hypothetical protein